VNVAQMRTASWSKALIHERARCTASSLEANSRLAAPAMAEGSSRTSVVVSSQRRASALSTRETREMRQGTPATVKVSKGVSSRRRYLRFRMEGKR